MPQSFASLHAHLVFSTKHREPRLNLDLHPRLFEYIGGILRDDSCRLISAGGMPDHVHLLVSLGRGKSIADTVRLIKSNSSGWIARRLVST
jgi:putative transposase